jgi:hypothetical protein
MPDKYKHFRKRRIRNRWMLAGTVLALLAMLGTGACLWIKSRPHQVAATASMQSALPASTLIASPSTEQAAIPTITPTASEKQTPTATPPATPTLSATPTVSATKAIPTPKPSYPVGLILNKPGKTVEERFQPPQGFERADAASDSNAVWLRALKLLPDGTAPKRWNGKAGSLQGCAAVLDMTLVSAQQQSTETAVWLNAQYKHSIGNHAAIVYHFASGFPLEWEKWRMGGRIRSDGRIFGWVMSANENSSAASLREFLRMQFNFTNTRSLSQYDLNPVKPADLQPGDMLINPKGSVAVVADTARNKKTGELCFLLLCGTIPAEQPRILASPDSSVSPWYRVSANPTGKLKTIEYTYDWSQLKRFRQ